MATFLGVNLPFGMSNANNQTAQPQQPAVQTGQQQLAQPANQNQVPPNAQNAQDGNGNPANNADPAKGQGSSLDSFKDVFTLPTDKDGKLVQQADPFAEPIFQLDPAKLSEAAGKMNFAQGISPEVLQKAMSGQDPQAFMEVMSAAGRNAFVSAITASSRMTEEALRKNNARHEQALPERLRNLQVQHAQVSHPALAHPAAKPMVEAMKMQIAANNPTLSPDRVAEMATNYFVSMATDISSANKANEQSQQKSTEQDWSALLG